MPNVGFGELFVVFLLIILVVGPQKLPDIARTMGKVLRTFQQEMKNAQDTLRDAVDVTGLKEAVDVTGLKSAVGIIDVPDASPAPPPTVIEPQAPIPPVPTATAAELTVVREYEDT